MKNKKEKLKCEIYYSQSFPKITNPQKDILVLEGKIYRDKSFTVNIGNINKITLEKNQLEEILNYNNEIFIEEDIFEISNSDIYDQIFSDEFIGIVAANELIEKLRKSEFFNSELDSNEMVIIGELDDREKIKWRFLDSDNIKKIKDINFEKRNFKECRVVFLTQFQDPIDSSDYIYILEGKIHNENPIVINVKHQHKIKITKEVLKDPFLLFYDKINFRDFIGFFGKRSLIKEVIKQNAFSRLLKLKKLLLLGYKSNNQRIFTEDSVKWEILSSEENEIVKIFDIMNLGEKEQFYSRIEKLVDLERLKSVKIGIIGVGTGGAFVSVQLAKTGVGTLELFDFDYLELENIVRHVCTLDDIGRKKINALAELLTHFNPFLKVRTHSINITEKMDFFRKKIKNFDLLMECTGIPSVSLTVNEIAIEEEIPVIYGFVYPNAKGGFLMRVIPNKVMDENEPCLNCILPKIVKGIEKPVLTEEQRRRYTEVSDVSELIAEPGLSVDVTFISNFQIKLFLMTLPYLPKTRNSFRNKFDWNINNYNFFFWFNEPYSDELKPFKLIPAKIKRDPYCSHCNKENWYLKKNEKNFEDFIL